MNSDATAINAGTRAAGSASPMTADEAMDILSAAVQRLVAFNMAAEAAEAAQGTKQDAHAVSTAERSQSHA